MRRLILVLSAAFLAACSGVPPPLGAPGIDRAYRVAAQDLDSVREQGEHWGSDRLIVLNVHLDGDPVVARLVAAHEIGHALGAPHMGPPGGVMFSRHGKGDVLVAVSPAEAGAAKWRGLPASLVLLPDSTITPALLDALVWACGSWNAALGEAVCRVDTGGR